MAFRSRPPDLYSRYEKGMSNLLELLGKTHQQEYGYALVFEQRLAENIEHTRLFGDTQERRVERADIICQLNRLACVTIGVSFRSLYEQPPAMTEPVITEGEPSGQSPVILFVDNDEFFLRTRKAFLENNGYCIIQALDPTTARQELESGKVTLAIVDVRLQDDDDEKDVSGLILAEEVAPHIPKIILTGYPSVALAREALRPRPGQPPVALDFVGKIEGPESMLRAVANVLEFISDGTAR